MMCHCFSSWENKEGKLSLLAEESETYAIANVDLQSNLSSFRAHIKHLPSQLFPFRKQTCLIQPHNKIQDSLRSLHNMAGISLCRIIRQCKYKKEWMLTSRLGSILFAVMVDDLLRSWSPRVKFVDDLTVLEIVPCNSPSVMRYIANDIHSFAINHNMRLNAKKCKLLPVSFLHYDSSVWPPLFLKIDSVESFKFLGIYISSDLSWTKHCDVIVKKANRRLYAIRKLKGACVKENDLVAVYCSLIRSILEYGSVAFAHLPNYLSNTLEGIQKRALSIIYPESSYDLALKRSNLTTLVSRRADACRRFIESIQPNNPLYHIIKHNCAVRVDKPYNLRHKSEAKVPYNTFRFGNFVTYKYS